MTLSQSLCARLTTVHNNVNAGFFAKNFNCLFHNIAFDSYAKYQLLHHHAHINRKIRRLMGSGFYSKTNTYVGLNNNHCI